MKLGQAGAPSRPIKRKLAQINIVSAPDYLLGLENELAESYDLNTTLLRAQS